MAHNSNFYKMLLEIGTFSILCTILPIKHEKATNDKFAAGYLLFNIST